MIGRERQFDVVDALLDQIEADRSNAPTRSLAAANAPEALARSCKGLIPTLALEAPPKAVRIEDGAMSALADGLDGLPPSCRFENVGSNAQAVFGITRHVTRTVLAARHPVLRLGRRQGGPRSLVQVRWLHPNGDGPPARQFRGGPSRVPVGSSPPLRFVRFDS